jgi:sugar transferase (PEP-CTERM system associated)
MIRLFRVFVPVGALILLLSEILLVSSAFILATYIVLDVDPTYYLLYEGGIPSIVLVLVSIVIGLYLHDLYSDIFVKSRIALLQQLCLVIGIAFLTQGFIAYLSRNLRMPIHVMVLGSFMALTTIFVWRVFFSAYAVRVVGRDRLLLVGGSPVLEEIGQFILEHPEKGLSISGYVDDVREPGFQLPGGKVLGPLTALRQIVAATQPNRIVVGMFERRNRLPVGELLNLRFAGHIIEEASTAYESVCGRICLNELRPSHLIYTGELGPNRTVVVYQQFTNVAAAVLGLIFTLPFMLLTALAVRISSPGPILYRQVRVGLNGAPFQLYKFRSMRADAEAVTGAVWATRDDPRVTRVGRVLRLLRLDELPQLINVLKGEMAIVGPRPERPEFVKTLSEQIPYYQQRHAVLPGITGWAQINFKYGDSLEDTVTKLEYDLYYIKNMSAGLDLYVIFHTLKAMLLSRGSR